LITGIIVSYFVVFNVRESVTFRVETPVFSVAAIDEEVRGPIHVVPSGLSGGETHSLNAYGQLFKFCETGRPRRLVAALYLWRIGDIAKKIKNKKSLSK
jgi:hypothetical protein